MLMEIRTKPLFSRSPSPIVSPVESDIRHTNLYLYTYINCLKNVTLTIGASGDFFQGGIVDRNQFNPKLGVTWNPFPSTTLRGALFRTFNRTLINSQTIEPTQVAGFNQFFDDSEATDAWRYGLAVDQKFSKDLFGGAEFSGRHLNVPYESIIANTSVIRKVDWEESLGRVYLFWTPHPWFALSAQYQYERFEREKAFVSGIANARTNSVPTRGQFLPPLRTERLPQNHLCQSKRPVRTGPLYPRWTFHLRGGPVLDR